MLNPNRIICISGEPGSGKSAVGKRLAELCEAQYISLGSVQRKLAQKLGLSTLDLNKRAESDNAIDAALDEEFDQILENVEGSAVIDSRMGWWRVPQSVKVRLLCRSRTAAQRVMQDQERANRAEQYGDGGAALDAIKERRDVEVRRYVQTYGVDVRNPRHYNLIVATDQLTVDEVVSEIFKHIATDDRMPTLVSHLEGVFPTEFPDDESKSETALPLPRMAFVGGDYFIVGAHDFLRRISDNKVIRGRVGYVEGGDHGDDASVTSFVKRVVTRELLRTWERRLAISYEVPTFMS